MDQPGSIKGKDEEGILVHILDAESVGTKAWITSEGDLASLSLPVNLLDELRRYWHSRQRFYSSRAIVDVRGSREQGPLVIAERLVERRSLAIFGAGHVGYNIALIGTTLGLRVLLLDDREVFLQQARQANSEIEARSIDFSDIVTNVKIAKNSAVVIVTRGHQSDEVILKQVSRFNAGYVGMIGSRRRVEGVFRRLREQGVSDSFLREVRAPIGLDIGAKTPQEIAVAVHAEIIKHFSGADS